MDTSYVTKRFYLKRDGFCLQRMNKKNKVRKLKDRGQDLKHSEKTILIKKKKKKVF